MFQRIKDLFAAADRLTAALLSFATEVEMARDGFKDAVDVTVSNVPAKDVTVSVNGKRIGRPPKVRT
jgi:hypothetical protein